MNPELSNFIKLLFAKKLFPTKYSKVNSYIELENQLSKSPEESKELTQEIDKYSKEELEELGRDLLAEDEIQFAKKGASLKKLAKVKKPKLKKCSCGCDMTAYKEKGGKIVLKCACGCKK